MSGVVHASLRLDEMAVKCDKCGSLFARPLEGPGKSRVRCDRCSPARRGKFKVGAAKFADLSSLTRDELFASKAGQVDPWGTARSVLQQDARAAFAGSGRPYTCKVCGYSKHIEVAHVHGAMAFPGDTLISVINHVDNLVALCPTHHREFDRGLMDAEDLEKLKGL